MRHIAIACGALLLLAGCATLEQKDKLREQTLDNYAAALRWGDFASAWSFVDPAVRAAHPPSPAEQARYDSVRVAEYDTQGPQQTGENTVEQTAHIRLIVKASQTAYDIVDHQTWRWDPQAKRWWLESGLPDIAPRN